MGFLLFLLLLGFPAAILLTAGIWLVRQNRSTAHHLTGVIFIVLGLLLLAVLGTLVIVVVGGTWLDWGARVGDVHGGGGS